MRISTTHQRNVVLYFSSFMAVVFSFFLYFFFVLCFSFVHVLRFQSQFFLMSFLCSQKANDLFAFTAFPLCVHISVKFRKIHFSENALRCEIMSSKMCVLYIKYIIFTQVYVYCIYKYIYAELLCVQDIFSLQICCLNSQSRPSTISTEVATN